MNGLSNLISGLSERFTREEQVSAVSLKVNIIKKFFIIDFQLENFLEEAGENLGSAQGIVQSSIEAAKANIAWTQSFSDELRGWFTRSGADTAFLNLSVILIVVLSLNTFVVF